MVPKQHEGGSACLETKEAVSEVNMWAPTNEKTKERSRCWVVHVAVNIPQNDIIS